MKTQIKMRMLIAIVAIMAMLVGSANAQERDRSNEVKLDAKGFKIEFTTREDGDWMVIFVKDETLVRTGMEIGFAPVEGDLEFPYEWLIEDFVFSKKMPIPIPLESAQVEDIKKSGISYLYIDNYTFMISDKMNEKIIKEANKYL